MYQLLVDLTGSAALHQRHVFKNQVHIEVEVARQKEGGANAQNIDVLGVEQLVHHLLKNISVQFLDDVVNAVHVPLHHAAQNIPAADLVAGHLNALDGCELAADQLLQGLLHIRIPGIAQLRRKAHHRGLADLRRLSQLTGGHERRLVIIFQNVLGDTLLPLGERVHPAADGL